MNPTLTTSMTLNTLASWEESLVNTSIRCAHNMSSWEQHMDQLYTSFYIIIFILGFPLNAIALWVLCRYIRKRTKAVIFMTNLAIADLAHVLSLPLRIYYYLTHTWPFGRPICLLCFYLKYLNMYASILFLVCISLQRCVFLLKPFYARRWRRRYDVLISIAVWVVASLGCSPFIIVRSSSTATAHASSRHDLSYSHPVTSTQGTMAYTNLYASPLYASSGSRLASSSGSGTPKAGCFKDLPTRQLSLPMSITIMALAELFGFLLPLAAISYSSARITHSLHQRKNQEQQNPVGSLSPSAYRRSYSVSTSTSQTDRLSDKQTNGEKRRALQMVLSCFVLFLVCFAPYHLNFLLYLMVSQHMVPHCATQLAVRQFHPMSLCLASLSCCLNPFLYYFLTAEFRQHLSDRTSSFTSSVISSPLSSSFRHPAPLRERLMSMESTYSNRE